MNEATLVEAVDPGTVALKEAHAVEPSTQNVRGEVEPVSATSVGELPLGRALLISMGVTLLLAVIAFWPSHPEPSAPRPTLEAPIVFDVLNAAPLPQAHSAAAPVAPPTSPPADQK